jgi:hypothetical protein
MRIRRAQHDKSDHSWISVGEGRERAFCTEALSNPLTTDGVPRRIVTSGLRYSSRRRMGREAYIHGTPS